MKIPQTSPSQRFLPFLNNMLMELVHCWQRNATEIIIVESAFLITKKHCERVRQECWSKNFDCEEQIIIFYKHIQPQFSGRLIYYSILYEALGSLPVERTLHTEYWQNEGRRLQRFTTKYKGLINYIDSGTVHRDEQYFLQREKLPVTTELTKIFHCGPNDPTMIDAVVGSLHGERSYHDYVQWRLERLQTS